MQIELDAVLWPSAARASGVVDNLTDVPICKLIAQRVTLTYVALYNSAWSATGNNSH